MPSLQAFVSLFGYAILSSFCYEYCWAKCATLLGPIPATVGSVAFMLPSCLLIDFVIWPDPQSSLSNIYVAGMILVLLSFLVVSLKSDEAVSANLQEIKSEIEF